MNTMRTVDIKSPPRITTRKRSPSAIRVIRAMLKLPPAVLYKPDSKWPVVIAFVLAIALHVGAVALVEMHSQERTFAVAQNIDAGDQVPDPTM